MNEKQRAVVHALFWTVMAAAILAILLLPVPIPPSPPRIGIVKPAAPATINVMDVTYTPASKEKYYVKYSTP